MTDKLLKETYKRLTQIEEVAGDDLHTKTIDFLDDMLDALDKNEQYGEKGDMLRYALTRLQQVGQGRD